MKMIQKIKKPNNLKALGVETVVFVLLFGLLGTLLLFEQKGYRAVTNTSESTLIDEDRWYEVKNENAGAVVSPHTFTISGRCLCFCPSAYCRPPR